MCFEWEVFSGEMFSKSKSKVRVNVCVISQVSMIHVPFTAQEMVLQSDVKFCCSDFGAPFRDNFYINRLVFSF